MQSTERAYRTVLGGWGDPKEEETWTTLVADLRLLAEEYGEDLEELVRQ